MTDFEYSCLSKKICGTGLSDEGGSKVRVPRVFDDGKNARNRADVGFSGNYLKRQQIRIDLLLIDPALAREASPERGIQWDARD